VHFSYSFFFEGLTGITMTVGWFRRERARQRPEAARETTHIGVKEVHRL
jgi:hypothetical protein